MEDYDDYIDWWREYYLSMDENPDNWMLLFGAEGKLLGNRNKPLSVPLKRLYN